ncbi:helix-turn-helix domain-containing protein [Enterococcus sp. AZ126]|uniref:helix-turn-helix domain-containing protein n=1 Tax=Enterococcus sp. AZ126 TaxID=2774635 RepID=UPI003F27A9AC
MEPSFILALFQHGYKVRTSTLYHLLKGKRTSSVLLYGFLYDNLPFFHLFPEITEKQFNDLLASLVKEKLLLQTLDGEVQITESGKQTIEHEMDHFFWINNYRFGKTDEIIWRLLQFTVQVVSNLSYANKQYVPLEQSPLFQKQVKMYIKSMPKAQLIETVKKEWTQIFSQLTNEEACHFAQQFSGYQKIGKTSFQLIGDQKKTLKGYLLKKEKLHHLLATIYLMPESSFLRQLILPLFKQNENKSMNETVLYLKMQLSIEELALKRRVKISTIKDHLMEFALTEEFPFEQFISNETSEYLKDYKKPYQDWEYRVAKQSNPELDYFEFRLYQIQKIRAERETSE